MEALIQLGIFLLLLTLGYVFGRRAEHRHYRSLIDREDQFRDIVVTTERLPDHEHMGHDFDLVSGSVVVSVDYFKMVAAGLRSLIGGRLRAYESLLDRARREAVLRMQQQARDCNAKLIINTKFETSQISGQAGQGIGSIEVLAYGTALIAKG
ncbi:heavy metal-binding domain-containing protein [Maricurvus nonylphenolicus]|uniref:YbjQ family protein n=1 Tax=Maricurvus nonylphenolicus TaxID=1008307 RepID=UPI0036F331D1